MIEIRFLIKSVFDGSCWNEKQNEIGQSISKKKCFVLSYFEWGNSTVTCRIKECNTIVKVLHWGNTEFGGTKKNSDTHSIV